jgi:1-acyl-sn-glycerol-3-phosphate acyltransferase
VIAANNVVSALFMVGAAGVGIGLHAVGFTIPQLFLFTAIVNTVVCAYIFTVIPEFLMRFIIWMLVHTLYRVEHRGLENLPATGPAVLVANHVSFVDALVIAAASRRPIRFVMDHSIFKIPILNFVFRTSHAFPIASRKDPARTWSSRAAVAQALGKRVVPHSPSGTARRPGS